MKVIAFYGANYQIADSMGQAINGIRKSLNLPKDRPVEVYVTYDKSVPMKQGLPDKSKLEIIGTHPWTNILSATGEI